MIAPLRISYTLTRDNPDGQPWPPVGCDTLWSVVRRADGCTLWRRNSD
jgi:hypothetical protein